MRVSVVTGAADGIGRAIAERLLADGWGIVGVDVDGDRLRAFAQGRTDQFVAIVGDVADRAVSTRAAEAAGQLGKLEGWVNNAGIEMDEPAHRATPDLVRRQIDVNLLGTMWGCAEAVTRFMRTGGGTIVSIGSIQSIRGFPGAFAYAATKGAINAVTRQLAVEYASAGIRVNAVLPGGVRTTMTENDWSTKPDPAQAREHELTSHPRGRVAEPDEIASVVAFLLSSDASFVSGQEIVVDGGSSSRCVSYEPDPDVLRAALDATDDIHE
jgi:NAD(P)-dependent dehydrogenase (short-subunit alcohol dehydrogenase family)